MSEGRAEDFQKTLCGLTFNPARYLKLFEILVHKLHRSIDFLTIYGEKF
jgi:hypothetical protein